MFFYYDDFMDIDQKRRRKMGEREMQVCDALEKVLSLARDNVLEDPVGDAQEREAREQEKAIDVVSEFMEVYCQ